MILTIDIGNTTISLCGVERRGEGSYEVVFCEKLATLKDQGSSYYRGEMKQRLAPILPEIEGSILSSVVPTLTKPVRSGAAQLLKKPPLLLSKDCDLGFTIAVKEAGSVGADRLADAAWAAANCPLPAVTVDMGTATTFNVISKDRVFLGGAIAPGLETGLLALASRASRLSEIELRTPTHLIGRDTEECMLSGAVLGAAALVDGIVAGFEREIGTPATVILTGGLSTYAAPLCTHELTCDPMLLPKGLALLYDKNR